MRSATVERALEWIKNRGSVQVNDGLAGITLPYRPPAWRPEATYCSVGSPLVRFLARSIAVFAEFERAMIVERVNSGLARAKAKGVKLGRGNKKDGERSADEERWGMSKAELEKRFLRLYKGGTGMGILKIGKTLGIGTGLVQRVVTEQPRPFDVDVAEPYAVQ